MLSFVGDCVQNNAAVNYEYEDTFEPEWGVELDGTFVLRSFFRPSVLLCPPLLSFCEFILFRPLTVSFPFFLCLL